MDDFDRIMNMSEAELDAMIRAEGGDPADYAKRGKQAAERALLTVQTFRAAQADLSIVKHQHALALKFTVGDLSFVIGDAPQTYGELSFRMMQFRKALCQLMEAARTDGVLPACKAGNDSQRDREPVAWRFKERINGEFDSDWILTKHEPPDGVRIIAKEPLYTASGVPETSGGPKT